MSKEFNLGAWMGRRQAFGALAGESTAAEAQCLREIRDQKLYLAYSPNWPDFCDRHIGISRAQADRMIQYLDEFGDLYFHVTGLTRIAPATYRAIAHLFSAQGLDFHGEIIPIDLHNAPRISAAVNALRQPVIAAAADSFDTIVRRLEDCATRLATLPHLTHPQRERLTALIARLDDVL